MFSCCVDYNRKIHIFNCCRTRVHKHRRTHHALRASLDTNNDDHIQVDAELANIQPSHSDQPSNYGGSVSTSPAVPTQPSPYDYAPQSNSGGAAPQQQPAARDPYADNADNYANPPVVVQNPTNNNDDWD
ncbi:hypothetical protein TVAG_240440 [Trichomonas vaginalis G3]|uniref:Uncharacterized protein n=1 Tax=Trichomonas vaginalis (strain ATCC PRA-98 / G3) TaxID=412133 RepID=A2EJ91_TRIV3|nr:hypothetical protein TVAGG3_0314930 [Trichomonas vaginalis G3]EAY07243.1 hypothetical protein TVAG_240440 [Trichomonas vaginalis G3]KAI5528884.1 hypothetical protein TVAGG3_0314930 [Trichomonas vaginalis G3]|eukprot:XP_001319466.1 hypothetical protein [Trichomonas vaginalis G3]